MRKSGGTPRNLSFLEISAEDFSAAVDYLTSREDVLAGQVGICGRGWFALNADGYFDSLDSDDRYRLRIQLNERRIMDYRSVTYERE